MSALDTHLHLVRHALNLWMLTVQKNSEIKKKNPNS